MIMLIRGHLQKAYRDNENDFKNIKLRQRVGKDASKTKLSKKFLGKIIIYLFGFSPCGMGGCCIQMEKYW